jgi:PPOX class probable F420-dependent enzyme
MRGWTAEARRFLEAHRVGHLATAGADGAPHVVPVCFATDDAGIYFVADEKPKRRPARVLRRLANLRANPRAALIVDDYADDWTRLAWLLVRGPARFLDERTAHAAALRLLRARYPQYTTMALDDPDAHPIVRIEPADVVLWRSTG